MEKKEFDPLSYIENAFLDRQPKTKPGEGPAVEVDDIDVPALGSYLNGHVGKVAKAKDRARFKRTEMSAPRPRRAKARVAPPAKIDPAVHAVWESIPRNMEFLSSFFDDSVTANYYGGKFRESRSELIMRLLDPELNLEETSRLLGVCPATVRRYTNRGWLSHHRTVGGQRRFRLTDVVSFVENHGRFPEE